MARFVMFTYPDPDYAGWDSLRREERQAEIDRHSAWFQKHRPHIQGGEELAWPRVVRTVRVRGDQPGAHRRAVRRGQGAARRLHRP